MLDIKDGDMVTVTKKLEDSRTQNLYQLDSTGYMLQMQGKDFKVEYKSEDSVHLFSDDAGRSFTFSVADVRPVGCVAEKPSQEFKFDDQLLDA